MKEFRKAKGVTAHYTSLEELRKAWHLKPVKKRTNDKEKLKAQQEKLVGTCRVCKKPLTWIEGNICACQNPDCRGFKMTGTNEDGTEKVYYIPVTRVLNDKAAEIAQNLFGE